MCYVKGQENVLTDDFSRNPWWGYGQPVADDLYGRPAPVEALVRQVQAVIDRRRAEDPALTSIKEQAAMDDAYYKVLDILKAGLKSHEVKKMRKDHTAQQFVHIWGFYRMKKVVS